MIEGLSKFVIHASGLSSAPIAFVSRRLSRDTSASRMIGWDTSPSLSPRFPIVR